jgi:deoxycytidine triphosphate deaminase
MRRWGGWGGKWSGIGHLAILEFSNVVESNVVEIPERRKKAHPLLRPPLLFSTSITTNNSCKDVVVPARDRAVVPTGLAIAAPHGTYARIAPRSGLAVKKFIDTGAGVVDEDYRGEVGVVLFNHSGEDFHGKEEEEGRAVV